MLLGASVDTDSFDGDCAVEGSTGCLSGCDLHRSTTDQPYPVMMIEHYVPSGSPTSNMKRQLDISHIPWAMAYIRKSAQTNN